MRPRTQIPAAFAVAIVALAVAGIAIAQNDAGDARLYTCGMHPQVVQEGPGTCPICGMDLTPMDAADGKADEKARARSGAHPVTIDPVVVQQMGVRVAHAYRMDLSKTVRTVGEVVVPDDAVSVVNLRFSGWIERIHVDEMGEVVRRGDPLFAVYSPELVQAQEEYLQAIRASGADSRLAKSARRRLDLTVGGSWLSRAARDRGTPLTTVNVPAPQSGVVLEKNVVLGARVEAGGDLYRIGSLERIWVEARVYEGDAPWVHEGSAAKVQLPYQAGRTIAGTVDRVLPTLDSDTRTVQVRLVFENRDEAFKPGMFATVRIETETRESVLAVPSEAILYSGERRIVFVSLGEGRFEPREVVTGLVADGHMTEIREGISEHEPVVTSGQFLLDSESQLQEAVRKLIEDRLEPRGETTPGSSDEHSGHDHAEAGDGESDWICPMCPTVISTEPGTCPICKMDLVEKKQ